MTAVDLSGAIEASGSVSGFLFISSKSSNSPQSTTGNVSQYIDPAAPAGGTYPGVADGAPNAGVPLQPFLRAFLTPSYPSFGNDGNKALNFTYPADAEPGDIAVVFLDGVYASMGKVVPDDWNEVYNSSGVRVWTHYLTDTEPGQFVNQLVLLTSNGAAQIGVWGNAQFSRILTNSSYSGATATAPQITIPGGDVGIFAYFPQKGYNGTTITWTAPAYFQDKNAPGMVGSYTHPFIGDYYPAHDSTVTPAITGQTGVTLFGTVNFSVHLKGLVFFPFATIAIEEAIGTGDSSDLEQYVHLMARNVHSPQVPYGYAQGSMNDTGSGVVYTYERWIRIRFEPTFNTVSNFRFWAPNLTNLPAGWMVKWGRAATFQTPVNTASSIAVTPVPTSDPGSASPNAGGETRLAGTGTQHSDWIVLQASADTAVVGPGPVLGFSTEGTLIPIQFSFTWVET